MTSQSVRQAARRAALDAQIRVRRREEERDKRRSRLGVMVVTALAQRDAQIRVFELRAGESLNALVAEEGLTAREAAEWCDLTMAEVSRLRRLGGRVKATDGHPGGGVHERALMKPP